jgi:GTP-binding protein
MLNFYSVNDDFFLVDLPGYGYARVPSKTREAWKALIEGYLIGEVRLRGVVHLVDARHPPTPADRHMVQFLAERSLPALIVLTKIDKLAWNARKGAVKRALQDLGLDDDQLLVFSSKTGEGRDELLEALEVLLSEKSEEKT